MPQLPYRVYFDREQLQRAVALRWVELAEESIRARGCFHVALAGGSTPEPVYRLLRREPLDWERIHLYWGDERDVPADHPDSNFRMAREALIDHVPIPADNVHPIHMLPDIEQTVAEYRQVLGGIHRAGAGMPCFDLIMLGMGDDGHIASLFPETSALSVMDTPVVSVYVEKLGSWRVTLTYPVLNTARHLMLLVTGENKASVIAEVLGTPGGEKQYPVQRLAPQGEIEWHLDQAAALLLPAPS